ncbi:MAG: O-antigen ligase family protein [Acidobacteriota bacterium]
MNQAVFPSTQHSSYPRSRGAVRQGFFAGQEMKIALFILAHIVLGVAMSAVKGIATAHALITIAVAVWVAASDIRQERVIFAVAYITGSEVLWRMTQAQVFWEFGKYAVIVVLIVAILRTGRFRNFALPFAYFALLLPSAVLPTINMATSDLRGQLSFNLSGPLALAICIWYFSQVKLEMAQLHRVLLFIIAPVVCMGTVVLANILNASNIIFQRGSNVMASGGFGPNQVSAMFGLGILASLLYLLLNKKRGAMKIFIFAVMIVLAVQSALTFSRTGLYSVVISISAALFYLIRDPRARIKIFGILIACFLLANFLILPKLDEFTNGTLLARFQNTSSTGRTDIVKADLLIWSDNPIFGVGPGRATGLRSITYRESAAHTEFTRLLAEHGIFGLVALTLLLIIGIQNFKRARSSDTRALACALTSWGFLFMSVSAMRQVAPAVAIGLAAITVLQSESEAPSLPAPEPSPADRNRLYWRLKAWR